MPDYDKVSIERLQDIAANYQGTIRAVAFELIERRQAEVEKDSFISGSTLQDPADTFRMSIQPRDW